MMHQQRMLRCVLAYVHIMHQVGHKMQSFIRSSDVSRQQVLEAQENLEAEAGSKPMGKHSGQGVCGMLSAQIRLGAFETVEEGASVVDEVKVEDRLAAT
ncbi:uncharacterized protein EI97DRAFT_155367 [Westerdykella ornata]|uniref:Uncharacterized protein n=1 Tax=Westerdykella ornata TaxID=318751 RepID=A0A6A6JEL0_WESOR|nr:uncharacterized protein EI97DRAFT_155367 [Westerdykella ornata]KAF2273609.1 hypothetical protein EI97DRAFT_155367 [Westerdykella ornata]